MSNTAMLRALIVAPTPTWPLNFGNRKRIFSVCNGLKNQGYEIHFVHYVSEGDWRDYIPVKTRKKMEQQWDYVDHIMPSVSLHEWPKQGEDHLIDEWWDWSLENHLRKTLLAREYDVVIVNYTWLSKALELVPEKTYKVLDTHDKFSGRRLLLEKNNIGKEFFHTTEEEEVKGLNRADMVWAIKPEEELQFREMGVKAKIETLLHIDEQRASASPSFSEGVNFGFVGANNNINKVNISRFIEVAEPIFKRYLPPLTLKIAGSICKDIENIESPYIDKIGYVESMDSFYDEIHAAIIPMEFSTGLKIKVAEALSQSKPLISHEHAMEGFEPSHKLHQCKSFEEIAQAMCEISFEFSELQFLKDATNSSFNIVKESISNCLRRLTQNILDSKQIVIILPKGYGDKTSLKYWMARSRLV